MQIRVRDVLIDRYIVPAQRALGVAAAGAAAREGREMSFEEAVAVALNQAARLNSPAG